MRNNTPIKDVNALMAAFQKSFDRKKQKLELDNNKLNNSILSITKWSRFKEKRKKIIDKYI